MAFKVTESAGTLDHDGKVYKPGDTVPDLSEAQAAQLLDIGAIEDAKPAKGEKPAA